MKVFIVIVTFFGISLALNMIMGYRLDIGPDDPAAEYMIMVNTFLSIAITAKIFS